MSPLWNRTSPKKPADVVAMESEHGRALGWGTTVAGQPVIATVSALVIGGEPIAVLPWHCIDRAGWEPPVFAIKHRDPHTGAPRRTRVELSRHGELPPVIRERVTRSVVVSRRVVLQGELGAVVAARRDEAGSLRWTVVLDPGLDAQDPDLQQRAREALAELRLAYGT